MPSGTAALDLSALLAKIEPGSRFIVSSFTFPSTANAYMLRGAEPIFVDIRPDTLCLDEKLVEQAIDSDVSAIVVTHYGGVGAEMDELLRIGAKYGIPIIEDAAHGLMASYRGRPLGTIGQLGIFSFHHTKNIQCEEGGALIVNEAAWRERAEQVHDKGTNRSRFRRGEISEYSWVEVGGNFHLADILAAYLLPQLHAAREITDERLALWHQYREGLLPLESRGDIRLPAPPAWCEHNGHIFHLRTETRTARTDLIRFLADRGIEAFTHFAPLHSSPFGQKLGLSEEHLPVTLCAGETILRLPLFYGLSAADVDRVIAAVTEFFYGR